ncbi:hypothetical protein LC574_02520 [Nostoc sp. CHAB 5715]|nr:hypothetical protein [Nostoc sp. CHAB 5715]MCC5620259.1 hypothetical protein [Nostoc sp. CHAB 5715]
MKNLDLLEICRLTLPDFFLTHDLVLSKVKAEVATDCTKHGNVLTEVPTGKAEVATDCAKHGNVLAEVPTGKAEVATDCAKHGNVLAEVPTGKAEVATDCAKHGNVNPGAIFFDGC